MKCTKIILASYKNFDGALKAIDKRIESKCYYSFSDTRPCERIAEEVFSLIRKKSSLLALKSKVDKVFSLLDPIEKDLLRCKYLDKKPENKFKFSLRTYFRKQAKLFMKLDEYFSFIGICDEKFFEEFKSNSFMMCAKIKAEDVKRVRCSFLENADEEKKLLRKTA